MSYVHNFIRDKVNEFGQSVKNDINNHSGEAARSIRVDELEKNHIKLVGADYIEFLNRGSGPWTNPEKYKKLGFILDKNGWAKSKGLNPFAAAYNIAHFGSQIFQKKKSGLQIELKREQLQKELNEQLPKYAKADVMVILNKFTNQFKNASI